MTLDGELNTIIGVLPKEFHFVPAEPVEFWTTVHDRYHNRDAHNFYGVARMKKGVSLEQAAADMKTVTSQLERQYPNNNRGRGSTLLS